MVDHLNRVKRLALRLRLTADNKDLPAKQEHDKLGNNGITTDSEKVKMRHKPENNGHHTAIHDDDDDNDDEVFCAAGEEVTHVQTHMYKKVRRTPHVVKHQLNAPVVNKRLKAIKRPLASTKSMPLSPVLPVPDDNGLREQKLRDDVDFLCREMVSLRLKDQEIAKSLLKVYAEIQSLKVKKSCLLHKELLEEATYDVEKDDLPDMCDAPHKFMSKILLNRGVTKQNIAWRRFSCS